MGTAGPKSELTAFDLLVLVEEMQGMVGSYVEKVLQPTPEGLVLRLRKPGTGRLELVVEHGRWIYLREKEPGETGAAPPPAFAMLLRKHLEGRRVTTVEQKGFERILVVGFDEYSLVIELFREGNIILVKGGEIVKPLHNQRWEHREVRSGVMYEFPPSRLDPRGLGRDEFEKYVKDSKSDLVRTLAVALNLGGRYAEEVCARSGLERNLKVARLTPEAMARLYSTVEDLFASLAESRRPATILRDGVPLDFTPIPFKLHEGQPFQAYPTFNVAAEAYAEYWKDRELSEETFDRLNDGIEKIRRQMENQEAAVKGFRDSAEHDRRVAHAISGSVEQISGILRDVNSLRTEGGWDAVAKATSGGKLGVAEVRPHEGRIVVRLKDDRGELEAALDIRKKARENATAYYSASKEAEEKAKRTILLIEETKARIEKLERDGLAQEESQAAEQRARKPHWYERYRWFISSDGLVVIGGRDASSNDRIVKRHLGEGDIYAHADVHGAPSVVVKRSGAEIPERTLREACEFALAYSKAWGAGAASGSSYWVNPDQVSKTPESGEYLPKGAFVVRGRKNIFHDLEPRLALGWVEHEGERILMCGPESAVRTRSQKVVIIQPGGDEREQAARRIAKELGCSVDDVLRLLPSGNSTVLL